MLAHTSSYLMENLEEAVRLEIKTNSDSVLQQALWCGVNPGMYVLDAGCGPGKITSILHRLVQPEGRVLGVDYSETRILYAQDHYGGEPGISFRFHDLRDPLEGDGPFDLIWVRFVLEYNRMESADIVKILTDRLKPGGTLCLLDLDHNCLSHYELPPKLDSILGRLMSLLENEYNFDPYSGRKLYSYLYDLGYRDIEVSLIPHHLIYGPIRDEELFNWIKKVEVVSAKTQHLFKNYPGGHPGFFSDFEAFFLNERRFTYTPLILCKGTKPAIP